jgi:hypothetical protein
LETPLLLITMSSVASSIAHAATAKPKAPPQGGVLEHVSPVMVDPKNPIILFIIQVSLNILRQMVYSLT